LVPEPVAVLIILAQVGWVLNWIRSVRQEYAR
jgi:hypothetical protein